MKKAVLISINKPHTDNIFTNKKKTVEWRKKPLPLTTHYGYETKNKGGIGKVRGQFDVVQNVEFNPLNHHLYTEFVEQGCVPPEDLIEYANGGVIYGNVLENIEEYDKPIDVSEFERACPDNIRSCTLCRHSGFTPMKCNPMIKRPPQSWCYVEERSR
jgi:predicted transcriptional regulator